MASLYEGWKNRETWALWQWMNNDSDLYEQISALSYRNAGDLAEQLEELFLERMYETDWQDTDRVLFDIVEGALAATVDYSELATAWVQTKE